MEALFLRMLNMSLSAAIVILVIVLLRLPLRRAPKKWSYLLWIAAAFRLCCPVSFQAFFSIFRLRPPAAAASSAVLGGGELTFIPGPVVSAAPNPVPAANTPIAVVPTASASVPAQAAADPAKVLLTVCAVLWLTGLAAMLIVGAVRYLRIKGRLSDAALLREGVFASDAIRVPFILALLPPRIYVPAGLEGKALDFVLAHERAHLRRGDPWVKLLSYLLLSVHWFNPLVWLSFYLVSRDMEMSCDERVLSGMEGEAEDYSRTLLAFAAGRRFPAPAPLAFGESDVKSRIKNALCWRKPKLYVTVLAVALCLAAVAACTANPREKSEETPAPTAPETPWEWSSTLQVSDVRKAVLRNPADGQEYEWDTAQCSDLVRMLNALSPDQVVRGRGIPSEKLLDLRDTGYSLRFAGGVIELDVPDPGAEEMPGVWEIHDDALYEWLEAQWEEASLRWAAEADPPPTSASEISDDPANHVDDPAAPEDGLSRMVSLTAEEITGIFTAGWVQPEAEELVPLMNAAAAHPASLSKGQPPQVAWWQIDVYLSGGPDGWSSLDEHYNLWALQTEGLIFVRYWDGQHEYGGAEEFWLEDAALYNLIRGYFRSDGVIESDAWEKYGAYLEARAQETVDTYAPYGAGRFIGFDIIRLEKTDHILRTDDGEALPVYAWNVAFYPEDVNHVGWVGGMKLDANERVVGFEQHTYFAVRDTGEEPELIFLFWDEFLGEG